MHPPLDCYTRPTSPSYHLRYGGIIHSGLRYPAWDLITALININDALLHCETRECEVTQIHRRRLFN